LTGYWMASPLHYKEGSDMSSDLEGLRDQQDQQQGEIHHLWAEIKDLRERIEVLEGCDDPDNYPKQSVVSRLRKRWEQFKGRRKVRRG